MRLDPDGHPSAEAEPWYRGAVGERIVAAELSTLGNDWTVLHSVPVGTGGSDIDHVLIGPSGVYTLNTKHHRGKSVWVASHAMMVGGSRVPHLRNAAHEAQRAERLLTAASGLSVDVIGLIVLVGVTRLTIKERPDADGVDVRVVRQGGLLQALHGRRVYSEEQVRRIAAAAARPGTWSPRALPATDPALLTARFDEFERKLRARPSLDYPRTPRQTRSPAPRRPEARPAVRKTPPKPRARGRREQSPWGSLIGSVIAIAAALTLANSLSHPAAIPRSPAFATVQAERTALAQAAGTAAYVLKNHAMGGIPASLVLSADGTRLATPTGILLVTLPAKTEMAYAVGANGHAYTLTLTGSEYGDSVVVTPEGGVVMSR